MREETGNKNWVLYNPNEYYVRKGSKYRCEHLHLSRSFKGKVRLPINASSCCGMFNGLDLAQLDFSVIDTFNIVDMSEMFDSCKLGKTFTPIFNTSNVKTMRMMFMDCEKTEEMDLSHFDVSKVADFSQMLSGCLDLEKINLAGWNTESAEDNRYNKIKVSPNIALTRPIQNDDAVLALCIDPSQSYNYCNNVYNLKMQEDMTRCKLDLRIRTSKNYEWFREETGDKRLVLFDTSMYKVKRIKGGPCFLHYIGDSTLAPELPINASSCAFMFAFRKDLKKINLSNFSTEGVVTTKGMFAFCNNLEELDTSLLNTESVVDYTDMFRGCKALTQLDLCRFSLQSAKRTRGMFLGCTSLKEILTTKLFDTQDVLDGYKMFERCISLPNYRNNILVQSAMARPIKDGGYLTITSKRVLAQDLKALQS